MAYTSSPTSYTKPASTVDYSAELDRLTQQQVGAARDEIGARYGLTRAELEAQQGQYERAFGFQEAQLGRTREENLEAVESNALQRGIFNSGIYGENVAEQERAYAESIAFAEQDKAAKLAAIANALSQLDAQSQAEMAQLEAQIRREELMAAAEQYGA